jgi:hypothetical protein
MCSPSLPQHQNKRDKSDNVLTSSYAPTTIVSAISVPVIINSFVREIAEVPNDDTMSYYSEVSYDDDDDNDNDGKEHAGVDRWSPSLPGCHSISDTLPPLPPPPPPPQDRPLPLSMRESRWSATLSKTSLDSPPMYCSLNRKRQRPAELSHCILRDVPFRAPVRFTESGETVAKISSSSNTRFQSPRRLGDATTHPCNKHNNANENIAASLQRTIDILDAALEIVNDDVCEYC